MAIKVKHEGNVTSRVVASSLGGQARRNAEDSKALSQRAAQENMAANRQLNGAHASPASPGHASAQLGNASAPMASAQKPSEFTSRQMAEWNRLNNAIQDIQSSERYTPNEKMELIRQIEAKRAGIKPLPSLPQISADDEMNANTIERNGVLFDRSGKVLYNPHEIEMKRMDAQMKRYTDMATKLQQGRRVSKLEQDDMGDEKWVTVYEPIPQEEQDEILGRFFPDIHVRSQGEQGPVIGSGTDMGNALSFTIGLNGTPTSAPGAEPTPTPQVQTQAPVSASAEEGSKGKQKVSDWKKKLGW